MAQNYFRLISLLTDIVPRVLGKFLEDQWQRAGYSSLIDLLNQEKHRFYHCLQPGRKHPRDVCCCGGNKESYKSMTVAQWELLYQDTGASATCLYTGQHPCKYQVKASVKLEDLDITLLGFIINKVFPGNTALDNIRKHRNEVIHSGTTSISDSEFQRLWFSARSSILQIANTSAAPFPAEIQQEIDELEKRSMDPIECERLGKIVKHLTNTDNLLEGISEGISTLKLKTESIETIVLSQNSKSESMETNIESTATDTRSMKADVQTLNTRVESMETNIESTATDTRSMKADVQTLYSRVESMKTNIESTATDTRSMKADVQTLNTRVESMETNIKSTATDTRSMKADVQTLNTRVESMETNIKSTATDTRSMKADVQTLYSRVESMKTNIESTATDTRSMKADVQTLYSRVESMKTNIESTATDTRSMKADVQTLNTRVESMETNIKSTATDTRSMKADVQTLNTRVESMETNIKSTATDTRSMKADVQTLYSRVESMKTNIESTATDTRCMKTKLQTLDTRVESIETSVASIATDVKSIDRQKNAKPTISRHPDIEHRIENTESELKSQTKGFYVSLGAVEEKAYKRLLMKHLVTIAGRAGSGKTSLGKQLMIKYCDQHTEADGTPTYTPVIISKPEDFDKISSKDRLVVFIDDPFGASNVDDKVLKEWNKHFEKLLSYCNEGSIRVIIGVRSNLISEPEKTFRKFDLFSKENVLDLSSKQEITSKDKLQLLKSYCKEYKVQITGDEQPSKDSSPGPNKTSGTESSPGANKTSDTESSPGANKISGTESSPGANKTSGTESYPGANKMSGTDISPILTIQMSVLRQISELDTFEGFPKACFQFFTSPSFFDKGTYFFAHATDILIEEISKLDKREPLLYFTLAFMLLEGGRVDLDDINEAKLSEINDSEMNHGLGRKNRKVDIKDTCKSELSKVYIDRDHSTEYRNRGGKHDMRYKFTHQTVLEAVLMSLWDRYPELVLHLSCDNIIVDFVRPSGYNQMQNEICVNVPPGYDNLLAQKVVSNGCWLIRYYRGVSDASFVENLLDVSETTENLYWWYDDTEPISLSEAINDLLHPFYVSQLHLKKAICTRYTHNGYEYNHGTKQQTCDSPCHPQNKRKLLKLNNFLELLNFFIETGEVDFVEQLMESHDIDPMSDYEYRDRYDRGCNIVPVCYAAESGYKHLLMFWMKKNVTVEKHDNLCLILDKCCKNDWTDILEQIIQNHRHGKHEKVLSPSFIYSNVFQVGRQMTKYFLQSNIDITLADNSGNTLLHHCSKYGFKTEILMILKKHAEIVNVQNKDGETAICLAAKHDERDTVKELFQHGADISIQDNDGCTILHYCAVYDWDDIIQQFVTNTMLLEKKNKKGFSPGHIAVLYCSQKVVKTLIEAGVNLQYTKYSSVVLVVLGLLINYHWLHSEFVGLHSLRLEPPSEEKYINHLEYFIRHNKSLVTSLWEPLDDSHYTVIHYHILQCDLSREDDGLLTHIISTYPRAKHARNKTRLPTALHLAAYLGKFVRFVLLYFAGVRITDGDLSIMDTIQLGRQNAENTWDSLEGWRAHEGDCLLQKFDFPLLVDFGSADDYEEIQKFYTSREHRR